MNTLRLSKGKANVMRPAFLVSRSGIATNNDQGCQKRRDITVNQRQRIMQITVTKKMMIVYREISLQQQY